MPRESYDREDLLAEASALTERVGLKIAGHDDPLVVGFRSDGSASFYLHADRVYQFNSRGQMRRAFVGELLYKAEKGRLIALCRQRGDDEVALVRHELDSDALIAFMSEMRAHLDSLHHVLAKGRFKIVAQVPEEAGVVPRICCWLDEFSHVGGLADSPRAN